MLENSGLVLGVDSSLGLLTWLDNPRHIGVALLVHGRLLHLTQKETKEKGKWKQGKTVFINKRQREVGQQNNIIFRDQCIQNVKRSNSITIYF